MLASLRNVRFIRWTTAWLGQVETGSKKPMAWIPDQIGFEEWLQWYAQMQQWRAGFVSGGRPGPDCSGTIPRG